MIKSDNVVMGLLVCFMAFLAGGIGIATSGRSVDLPERHGLERESSSSERSELSRSIEALGLTGELGPDFEPVGLGHDTTEHDPGGLDLDASRLLPRMNRALAVAWIIVGFAGMRIMFTRTKVVVVPRQSCVQWQRTGFLRTSSREYVSSQVYMVLHRVTLRDRRSLDWHGFAASLANSDNLTVQLARSKTIEGVTRYAEEFRELTGIEIKQLGKGRRCRD